MINCNKISFLLTFTLLFSVTAFSYSHSNTNSNVSPLASASTSSNSLKIDNVNSQSLELIQKAKSYLSDRNPDKAFSSLIQAYSMDPSTPGLQNGFESVFRLRIDINESVLYEYASESKSESESESKSKSDSDKTKKTIEKQIIQDRFGLSSLLIDQERHEEASRQLRAIFNKNEEQHLSNAWRDKAISMLYRTQASACQWEHMEKDVPHLLSSVHKSLEQHEIFYQTSNKNSLPDIPPLHPFEALKWPCIGLKEATAIARCYANRAFYKSFHYHEDLSFYTNRQPTIIEIPSKPIKTFSKRIKIGYISPDFTSTHPLAFLMQNVFGLHNASDFETFLYSYSRPTKTIQDSEIHRIQSGANHWRCTQNSTEMIQYLEKDQLDILIDLCGYAGTNDISYIMTKRLASVQISYMGFPGSSGASYIDYIIVDPTVIPISKSINQCNDHHLRQWYTESLIYMPHCYFVNCHKYINIPNDEIHKLRTKYHLPMNAFVFCCHSRPDKIDPQTFRAWMRAMKRIHTDTDTNTNTNTNTKKPVVLWLLRSGADMEHHLRHIAESEYNLPSHSIVFCDIAPRMEHLKRLAAADLFLDTPAYNAHTLGCDTLYAGVPMVSLLRNHNDKSNVNGKDENQNQNENENKGENNDDTIPTDKWVSRVGASLLKAIDLKDMIVSSLKEYEDLMVQCVIDPNWYNEIQERLIQNRNHCPLFDTERWVRNMEVGLREVMRLHHGSNHWSKNKAHKFDIIIQD